MANQTLPQSLHIASGDLWAGAEVQLYTLVKALKQKLNVPVSVILLNHGVLENKLQQAGINVTVIDESKINSGKILRNLYTAIKSLQPDVIHTHRVKENILGSIAARACGVPSLRTLHGASEHHHPWWNFPKRSIQLLDWSCGRYLQCRVVAVSDDLASMLLSEYPEKKLRVIENGIDIDEIDNHRIYREYAYQEKKTFRIGIAGRLVPVKRVDLFIESARYMMDHHPDMDVSYHIFGDGPMRDELESHSKSLGTDSIIQFEGHCHDIYKHIQSVDIMLLTSDHEGLPMILLEAMALGTPVIAHAAGGIPRLLDHGQCGILVNDHSASGYAEATYSLLQSPSERASITRKSRDRVLDHYSATRNAENYLSVYSECILK